MQNEKTVSAKKQALYDAKVASELILDETVAVKAHTVRTFESNKDKVINVIIKSIDGDKIGVVESEESHKKDYTLSFISISDILYRNLIDIGADPFYKVRSTVRFVAYNLESVLFGLALGVNGARKDEKYHTKNGIVIQNCNWNPYVINANGEKEYYQREFVWTEKDNQLLIESIYNSIDCGKILVRNRSFEELDLLAINGDTDVYWKDIVDGKQRLNAINTFINNEYPDLHGNYFNDLSNRAQRVLTNHQLFSYAEMDENTSDEEVIEQFLKLNFAGVPQSEEHIEFVKSIQQKL